MKKLIFTVTNDLFYDQRMQKICRSLATAGYDVELVGRKLARSRPLGKENYKQTRLNCYFVKGKFFYIEYNIRLFFYLFSQKFDGVCAIDLDTIVPVYYAGRIKKAKLVYDAHEYFTEVPEVIHRKSVKKVWEWVERKFVPRFDVCYTVSQSIAQLFQEKYHKRFAVIMNVPVLRQKKESTYTDPKFVLYQGALNKGRGLENMLQAIDKIDVNFKLVGEGDLSETLRKQAAEMTHSARVNFLGYVAPDHLREITETAYMGIQISEPLGLSYYYSLGNKFFDYIHAGLPQICTTMPEYDRINSEYEVALIIPDNSVEEIKKAMIRLLAEDSLYDRLKKNCEVCALQYNWQNEEKKLVKIYDELFR